MKILLLSHRLPYPLDQGQNLRLFHLSRELSKRHEISLAAFGDPPYAPALNAIFRTIHTVSSVDYRRTPIWNKVSRSLSREHGAPIEPDMVKLIQNTIEKIKPDVILAGGWNMITYVSACLDVPVVADAMDERVLASLRALRYASSPQFAAFAIRDVMNSFRWDRHYLPAVRSCIFASPIDARWAQNVVSNLQVSVVENGVDHQFFQPIESNEDHPSVIFEGNQEFPPNIDAVRHFHSSIYPRILRHFPDCRFYIVGRSPMPAVKALASANVIVTGRVEDIRPSLAKASVFVCPMRMGAGIKNKILQAWAMAKPVVSTPAGIGGLAVIPNHNIIVSEGATPFADAVCQLLANSQRRKDIGESARETILAHHSWHQKASALESILERVPFQVTSRESITQTN
jgi:glycosyltransferase involved in cell wall biosynthesis